MRSKPRQLFCVSESLITQFSAVLKDKLLDGFEIESSGMSMGMAGPVWWAILLKY